MGLIIGFLIRRLVSDPSLRLTSAPFDEILVILVTVDPFQSLDDPV